MKEYGDSLRKQLWGGHVWNPSHFIATVSENTELQVKEYEEAKREVRDEKSGQRLRKASNNRSRFRNKQ